MKVFKFGGASVRNADAIENLRDIILDQGIQPLVIVVSAMAKSTNQLEQILDLQIGQKGHNSLLRQFEAFHLKICKELFEDSSHQIFEHLSKLYSELQQQLSHQEINHSKKYDRVVCYGELISSTIVHAFLNDHKIQCKHLDARKLIKTDSNFREGKVRWNLTQAAVSSNIDRYTGYYITQGFIASDEYNHSITLGREGSDFTAAILGSCLDAVSVTIWKDVPGVLNADPDRWEKTMKYEELSYAEAAEMTYYGASVIHPKTIRPLAAKHIPLYVKSFYQPRESGTVIKESQHEKLQPAIIFKDNQCLISFQTRDRSFINQNKVSMIFHLFEQFNVKVNLIQNSAISFSAVVDNPDTNLKNIINSLSGEFEILYNDKLELITIKNYQNSLIPQVIQGREVLLEQKTRKNFQALVVA